MIGIVGGGAFGAALAVALAGGGNAVRMWARDADRARIGTRIGVDLPEIVSLTGDMRDLEAADVLLLALPTPSLSAVVARHRALLEGRILVACCKGIDLDTGAGPTSIIASSCSGARTAVLTGPGFAADIARGMPTALTVACTDDALGRLLQTRLATPMLRLYRTTDVLGAELGGALKNVIAIAAGITIGAGLGESARAAVMTRGYAEMARLALALGARAETLEGLSGLGDLILTCTSLQSRNFQRGFALGSQAPFDDMLTVEGVGTAHSASRLAALHRIEAPITDMVAQLLAGRISLSGAVHALLSRPLKLE